MKLEVESPCLVQGHAKMTTILEIFATSIPLKMSGEPTPCQWVNHKRELLLIVKPLIHAI